MAKRLTDWFPGHINPARPGCYIVGYQRSGDNEPRAFFYPYHWFDGKSWLHEASKTPRVMSVDGRGPLSRIYSSRTFWRGLAADPRALPPSPIQEVAPAQAESGGNHGR